MKVAFLLMHPFSESMGSVVRVRELALALETKSVESYIFTPYEQSFDLSTNVHVTSLSSFMNRFGVSSKIYNLSKALYYNQAFPSIFSKFTSNSNIVVAKIVNNIAKMIKDEAIDIIQIEQDAALPFALGLKEKTELPVVVDVHNISSEELVSVGLLERNSKKYAALQQATKFGLSTVDHVIVVSEVMKDYVTANYGLSRKNVSVVPPGGRSNVECLSGVKRGLPPKVVYAGVVASREHVDLFVKSIPVVLSKHPDAEFYITKKGEDIHCIKKLAQNLQVKPNFFWFNKYSELNNFLSSCDVGVLPSSSDLARRMGTPAKLFTYLSAGLPIVANDVGGWTDIIKNSHVGLLTPDDPKEFGAAIIDLLDNPQHRQEYALNGLELIARKYNWGKSAQILLDTYCNLLTN